MRCVMTFAIFLAHCQFLLDEIVTNCQNLPAFLSADGAFVHYYSLNVAFKIVARSVTHCREVVRNF